MPDDEPLSLLQTPRSPESGSAEPDPNKRNYGMVVLITLGSLVLSGVLCVNLVDHPGGIQTLAMVAYTFLIPYIASDRFLNFVPWNRLIRGKALLGHCLALVVVYGITTEALAVKPRLPIWFITSGRRLSLFPFCLGGILLALAFCEYRWVMKSKDE
ncbi:MAG TPA: hypothetical protein VGR81_10515 [Candidatus Acidoferrales bacterium]|nr:hypothetical protein [Candidatus Acidoferrales bacterium]